MDFRPLSRFSETAAQTDLVVLTTFFPNREFPHRTVFLRNLVRELPALVGSVTVVAPVPYAPPWPASQRFRQLRRVPFREEIDGMTVLHPRYLVVPRIDALSGLTYALAVLPTLRRLRQAKRAPAIHIHCAYPDAVGGAIAARVLGAEFVVTVHGSDLNFYAHRWELRPQIRWALRQARGVIAVSQSLAKQASVLLGDCPVEVARIPCAGFTPEMFPTRPVSPDRHESPVILFVGNLVRVKAVDVLLQAFSERTEQQTLGRCRLVIIGDGEERPRLEAEAVARGVASRVSFVGRLPQANVASYLKAARVLCLPSHNEGLPNVVVEALASGVPTVVTDVGGLAEIVQDGVNGYLVPTGDPKALAHALVRAIERDFEPRALASSVADLTWSALAHRNFEFLTRVMSANARRAVS